MAKKKGNKYIVDEANNLEAVCNNDNAEQFWFELDRQFRNADEFIQLIPDYGKLRIE